MAETILRTAIETCNLQVDNPDDAIALLLIKDRLTETRHTQCIKVGRRKYKDWFNERGSAVADVLSDFSYMSVATVKDIDQKSMIDIRWNTVLPARNIYNMPEDIECTGYILDADMYNSVYSLIPNRHHWSSPSGSYGCSESLLANKNADKIVEVLHKHMF